MYVWMSACGTLELGSSNSFALTSDMSIRIF